MVALRSEPAKKSPCPKHRGALHLREATDLRFVLNVHLLQPQFGALVRGSGIQLSLLQVNVFISTFPETSSKSPMCGKAWV